MDSGAIDPGNSSRLPLEQLAQLEYDKSVQFFAILPLALVVTLAIAYCALYFYRRSQTWNELGEAMRVPQPDEHQQNQMTSAPYRSNERPTSSSEGDTHDRAS